MTKISLVIPCFNESENLKLLIDRCKELFRNENSIEIIKRSPGTAMKEHFNSSFQFKAVCYALICNPSIDTVLEAKIVSSNNAGFKAEVKDTDGKVIIDIIIPRLTSGIKHENIFGILMLSRLCFIALFIVLGICHPMIFHSTYTSITWQKKINY